MRTTNKTSLGIVARAEKLYKEFKEKKTHSLGLLQLLTINRAFYESLLCKYNFEQTQTHNNTSQLILTFIFALIDYADVLV